MCDIRDVDTAKQSVLRWFLISPFRSVFESLFSKSQIAWVAGSFVPAFVGALLWNLVGVLNMESALHIEYSLGTGSGWHSWISRGSPGEVIRHWGVPVYDQWSGLGYRLPTQGFLVDTPLSYLALVLPINSVMFAAVVASLWFALATAHRWIHEWASRYQKLLCAFFDAAILGMASFYALWHGWQFLIIQIAGAVVCLATLTERQILESPERVPLGPFMTKLSLGMLMVVMPHVGNGMTFAPAIVALSLLVILSRGMTLLRRATKRPIVFVAPIMALVALLPALLDLRRELHLQSDLPPYEPEFGFLNSSIPSGDLNPTQLLSWIISVIPLIHHFFFPMIGLFSPSTYLWSALPYPLRISSKVHLWSHDRAQFFGGVLAVILIYLAIRRPSSTVKSVFERTIGVLAAVAMFIGLFNVDHPYAEILALRWMPVWLLSNSRWQYADLSLLLVLVLLVLRANDVCRILTQRNSLRRSRSMLLRIGLVIGLLSATALFPYRVIEPLRLNDGPTRFAPLQTNSAIRSSNERWKSLLEDSLAEAKAANPRGAVRVVISDLIEPEGEKEWFGLRSTIQLREVGLGTVQSAPRIRSGQTLNPPRVRLRSNSFTVECENKDLVQNLRAQLDVLAVSLSVLPAECLVETSTGTIGSNLQDSPWWKNTASERNSQSIMRQLVSESARGNFRIIQSDVFHHWWSSNQTSTSDVCSFLSEPCLERLKIRPGKRLAYAPLAICREHCVATYELTELPPSASNLVVPLNYDSVIQAVQDGKALEIRNVSGLIGIDSSLLTTGRITFSVKADYIMNLRAVAPLFVLALIISAFVVTRNARHFDRSQEAFGETLD